MRFRPTPAAETPRAMQQLELAYIAARDDAGIDQLLLIPCVIFGFSLPPPLPDGNGAHVAASFPAASLQKRLPTWAGTCRSRSRSNQYKAYYYESLRASSEGWAENANSYFPFIENFLSTLYMCYKELDKRFAVVHGKRSPKRPAWKRPS